ncbi:hypothetical protein OKA05_22260 [Luteolibacter arcticus]|uniref:3-keto-disaccharide hydrolase domain-containing protein n=1 Tax=Luteolibacter arcticus TaxID=1581411 RepID=A0ABT3GP51_9BACT|nr:hypothetical protein [Luteolibacter arcticus]MCW1925300.1 hypothetical protein [Luteolibacter arcticus]
MKIPSALLLLAGCFPLTAQETEILCVDGSRIRGSLLGVEVDRLQFEAAFLAAPVPLRLEKVLEVSLPIHRGDSKGDHVATITLTNGDVLRGELIGIDKDSIKLRTWYAGELTFRRAMVDNLEIQDRPDLIYSGPDGIDGWTQSEPGTWQFEHGWLRAKGAGSIARNFELPAKARFAFDLSWRSNPRFNFLFYTDDITKAHPENAYELIIQGGRYVQLHKRWSKGDKSGSNTLGNFANVPELVNKERCRIEMLVDRKTGLIRMLVNGRVAQDWTDPDPDAGLHGGGMHFSTQDNVQLRVSRIEVTSWDGVLEGKPPEQDEGFMDEDDTPQPETDVPVDPTRIRLRNNDQIAGEMLGIENSKVKLKTAFGEVNLPVSRLRTFALHTKEQRENWDLYQIPKRYNGDVRAWFPDGGCITFKLEDAGGGKLEGSAQSFGKASFEQKAFARIEFNLYAPELDELRNRGDAW